MGKNLYQKTFASRAAISFFMVMLLLLTCVLRVTVIATGDYYMLQESQTYYKIKVSNVRGTIYDCNMNPITNSEEKYIAAVIPTEAAVAEISGYADLKMLTELKNEKPIICEVPEKINTDDIKTTVIYKTTNELTACHIVGYTDSTGHGVSGLQLAYDDLLYSDKAISAAFCVDAKGKALKGIEAFFENEASFSSNAVVTTLDIDIQKIAEKALSRLNSGCAVVAEANSGKIRAMASAPSYKLDTITEALDNKATPMINRAMLCYSIGSVFKPCVAAAILENNGEYSNYNCSGYIEIDGRKFRCHKLDGHGKMDLCNSLAQSCNCFFYNNAIMLGGDKIYKKAACLSINGKIKIADNIYTASGNLPSASSLNTKGAIANFSIGQGTLMSSPVAMLNLYLAIACDGSYYTPSIVEKTINDGIHKNYDRGYKTRVMNAHSAEKIRNYLKTVITEGTGKEAKTTLCTAAGKTATAQTGRYYDDGTEITNSWFCGFFPAEKPQYVVIVMSDSKLKVSTASVFAEIADEITRINA